MAALAPGSFTMACLLFVIFALLLTAIRLTATSRRYHKPVHDRRRTRTTDGVEYRRLGKPMDRK